MGQLWGKYHLTKITLADHTSKHVVKTVEVLFGNANQPTRFGECWLRFFKIPLSQWERFYWNLLASALLHDWGKANDGMQRILSGTRIPGIDDEGIRHEHFSALLIGLPSVTAWLQGHPFLKDDVPIVLSAVLTHHLKASARGDGFAASNSGQPVRLQVRDGHFAELVRMTGEQLGLPQLDVSSIPTTWTMDSRAYNIREHRKQIQNTILSNIDKFTLENQRVLWAVRAALIACDAAGSGYARTGRAIVETIHRQFARAQLLTRDSVWEIINKRIGELNEIRREQEKPPFEWSDFQISCDQLSDRALLLAPCGSGKTLAAWRWIAAQAGKRPVGRVLFLYPTRATAKEGFRDYVSWAPESAAALMHGDAAFDLHGMFDNGNDPRRENEYEADRRLFALGYWSRSVFSATVDQFLGFLQYNYGSMCMLPVLADSIIVIDEVHSFDRHMFTALKEFLKNFCVPVLCMTATLPKDRRKDLEDCGLKPFDHKPDDLQKIADALRYTLKRIDTRSEAFDAVREALADGQRVLWVANTVRRCHEITAEFATRYDQLRTTDGHPIYCYHSRFKLADRVDRHDEIVNALKADRPAALGITTQVCEMSLDLDVDLLITEECPVTSLIQRMGRCNRNRDPRPPDKSGRVLVYDPGDAVPYDKQTDLVGLNEFLGKTANRDLALSQADLETTLNELSETPPWLGDNIIMFFASGAYADGRRANDEDAGTFREGNDSNCQCVLPEDVEPFLEADDKAKSGFIVPVPKKLGYGRDEENEQNHGLLPGYLGVAAAGHYHPKIGFCDRPLNEWKSN